jgi:SSS family solute:Na+ symporter
MGEVATTLDIAVFMLMLVGVMAVGLVASRGESTIDDYFLASRGTRWWGVAGSIFGSNVSANHLVGMMGIGFTIGFAQSHFELGAIAGLMLLAYGFLPVYRKLRLYTLSEYLGQRYGESSRALYALIMIVIMVFVQMVPGLYIGSRSMVHLLGTEAGGEIAMTPYVIGVVGLAVLAAVYTIVGGLKAVIWTDVVQSVLLLAAGLTVSWLVFTHPDVGGWSGMIARYRKDAALSAQQPP